MSLMVLNIAYAKKDLVESGICKLAKITPSNYPFKFRRIQKQYKKFVHKKKGSPLALWKAYLNLNSHPQKKTSNLKCSWNKFIATDFIFYHEQSHSLFKKHNKVAFLKLRDELFVSWQNALNREIVKSQPQAEKLDIMKIKHIPHGYGFFAKLTKLINIKPKGSSPSQLALRSAHNLLSGKTVFNALFSEKAKEHFLDQEVLQQSQCVLDKIKTLQGQNIWSEALQCVPQPSNLLLILGVYSSQRMYLIRDFKKSFFRYLNDSENLVASKLMDITSEVYFRLETYGNEYGAKTLYPPQLSSQVHSFKPYHFYSVAFIAQVLAKQGYEEKTIIHAATYYSRKYKKNIRNIGFFYNVLLMQSLNRGTVSDYKIVLREQKLGASFGFKL